MSSPCLPVVIERLLHQTAAPSLRKEVCRVCEYVRRYIQSHAVEYAPFSDTLHEFAHTHSFEQMTLKKSFSFERMTLEKSFSFEQITLQPSNFSSKQA